MAQAGERPPGWWTRRRIRNARRLTPTPFQRIRSAIALVVLVGVFGVALAVGFGICLVVGAFLLESLAG
ncbi:MAG: hypothetical protein S0880_31675 [Actinomycetota bacterium]|nr:hypothetical protein [Actinomycetota bacterium]